MGFFSVKDKMPFLIPSPTIHTAPAMMDSLLLFSINKRISSLSLCFFCWWSLLRYSSFRWVCGWHFISFRSLLHVTLTEARKYFPKQYPLHFHFFFWLYHHTGHSSFHRAYINMENLFDCGGSSLGRMRTKLYAFLLFLFCPPPDA